MRKAVCSIVVVLAIATQASAQSARLIGPPLQRGTSRFHPPLLEGTQQAVVALASDTEIARATARFAPFLYVLKQDIRLGAPFRKTIPANAVFEESVDASGVTSRCLNPGPNTAFEPFEDDKGDIFPLVCVADEESGSTDSTVLLFPYQPERSSTRQLKVAKVTFARIDPVQAMKLRPPIVAERTLKITKVDVDVAEISTAVELFPAWPGSTPQHFDLAAVQLPLREGATANLEGFTLRASRAETGWQLQISGEFLPWARLDDRGGVRIRSKKPTFD